ncbi:major facilitator superfamily domain-containing protein [Russula aff. rugulosa BPL654]|nr:major facilitator superfamily domain-containing protein [Russula aff. rugulosa BPL654]
MSSSERPPSQASTTTESSTPTPSPTQTIDEKLDPWLVSFTPDDPENPMVRCWPVFIGFNVSNISPSSVELAPVETLVHHNHWRLASFEFVRAAHSWSLPPLTRSTSRTFSSSAPSNLLPEMMEYFGFGQEVGSLVVSLFISGYCLGPLLWGPLSEDIGRRPVFLIAFLFNLCFQVGCALSKNTASILIFRFLAGTFAAAPLTNSGGVVGDLWDVKTRGKGMLLFAVSPFAGPALGPVVSGWMSVSGVSWRWLFWVLTMFSGLCLVVVFLTMPETYGPVLLARKAKRIRKETGDNRYYAPKEVDKPDIGLRLYNILAVPFKILFLEPMLIAIVVYQSFLYGCIYLLFEAYPIVFTRDHHLNAGVSGLMYLPISIGGVVGVISYLVYFNPRYDRYVDQYAPAKVPPEARLEVTLVAAPLFAISFFWFGWTSYPSISYWSPLMAGGLLGFSIFMIFLSLINYTVDAYLFAAASALAASTVSRSIFGAAFPLFARQMFESLNPRWASTVLGLVAAAMIPIPIVLRRYGAYLRSKSKFVPNVPPVKPEISAV